LQVRSDAEILAASYPRGGRQGNFRWLRHPQMPPSCGSQLPEHRCVRPDQHRGFLKLLSSGASSLLNPQTIAACLRGQMNGTVIVPIENKDLEALRETASRVLLALLWVQVFVVILVGIWRGMDWWLPTLLAAVMAGIATVSWNSTGNGVSTRLTVAVAVIADVSIFTYQLTGHAWQIDIHMYFFAAMACLVAYCDYRVILVGTVAVALHHFSLNFVLPAAIFPGGADFGRVILHAAILIMESAVLAWLCLTLERLFVTTAQKTEEADRARAAEARANQDRSEAESRTAAARKVDMMNLANDFESAVGEIIETVSLASTELEASAGTLTRTAERAQQVTTAVAVASEEASVNVQSVASATEEMASSVHEISRQVQASARMASEAVDQARRTNERVGELSKAAARIGDVVEMINTIAGQTNMLALNATIEAARAGAAGRGFSVVAAEVKALAEQTARATGEIGQQISGIQEATQESVGAIEEISGTIGRMSEVASSIASAVEQQGAATQEISRSVQQAAHGTQQVSSNIADVKRGATETGNASSHVLSAAQSLAAESSRLKLEVGKFLHTVRAA
jgi:methyl-accepting chemotaxis protein